MYPGFDIVPLDGSPLGGFTGIDFTAFVRGPSIYDTRSLEDQIMEALKQELTKAGFATRHCQISGVGSSATGAPPFYEFLTWVHENWGFLKGVAFTMVYETPRSKESTTPSSIKWSPVFVKTVLNPRISGFHLRSVKAGLCGFVD